MYVQSTQWDTMASHYIKSPMEHDVCTEDQSYGDKHDVCTLYGTCGYMHMYLCAVKGGSTENQSRGTPYAWRVANEIQFHLHNVCTCIRV